MARPLLCDYIKKRENPLKIEIYEGSIDCPNDVLKNTDAVIAIEIIEHLFPDVLENVPYNIFGYIQPKLAIISTPNSDFNILFGFNQPNQMRHHDHKFEWSRKDFRNWCRNICQRFPKYVVSIFGIGNGPPEKRNIGKVSQMAVFIRKDMVDMEIPVENMLCDLKIEPYEVISAASKEYNLVFGVDFPYTQDLRTKDEKILDEAKYRINEFKNSRIFVTLIDGIEKCKIPIKEIFNYVNTMPCTIEELTSILLANEFEIISNNVITEYEEIFYYGHGDDMDELLYGPDGNNFYCDNEEGDDQNTRTETQETQISDNISEESECWD